MTYEPVPGMRSTIEPSEGGWLVQIPVRRAIFQMLFLPVWLAGWCFGEVFAVRQVFASSLPIAANGFLLVWLVGWTIGGAVAWTTFLWQLAGREELRFGQGRLTIAWTIFGLGRTRSFDLAATGNWRAVDPPGLARNTTRGVLGFGAAGTLAFDYGSETVRCGQGIDEAESAMLIDRLRGQGLLPAPAR